MLDRKILVIGDMIADVYLQGQIGRISREAPVLILDNIEEKIVAGGAANVVANVAALGGEVYAVGVVGDDNYAEGLKNVLKYYEVHTEGLVTDPMRPTISKTRVIAGGRATVSQQIVRIDRENKSPIPKKIEAELIAALDKFLPQVEGIVLSDYGSGTITEGVKKWLIRYAGQKKIPSIVDSRYDIGRFDGIGYIKQNDTELANYVGRDLNDMSALIDAGATIMKKLNANGALITRGEKGMSLFERGGAVHHIPVADKSEVFDVSGAGDTCVAAFILALTAEINPVLAARIANVAAGVAVRKLGTSTVNFEELRRAFEAIR
ncbi:MAG: carbohydrate kinase [Selenomonadaceae bacterium]|nr:carbohydrate kinase [Selenomonadaceae bacterium]